LFDVKDLRLYCARTLCFGERTNSGGGSLMAMKKGSKKGAAKKGAKKSTAKKGAKKKK
jgi:hypothetical protein